MVRSVTLPPGLGSCSRQRQRLIAGSRTSSDYSICWKMTRPLQSSRVVRSYPGALRAVKLLASDGRMNVSNECRSVESDEDVIDRQGLRQAASDGRIA
jgi:hypothetical protein